MSKFHGKQYPGAMRDHRAQKREEAEERNADYQTLYQRYLDASGDPVTAAILAGNYRIFGMPATAAEYHEFMEMGL